MKEFYINSDECAKAILSEHYGWEYPYETNNPIEWLEKYLERNKEYFQYTKVDDGFIIRHKFKDNNNEWEDDIKYTYNPNNEFNSFVSSASTHDGTLLFIFENLDNCAYDLIYLRNKIWNDNYGKVIGIDDKAEIIFGDMYYANANKPEFGTEEKPWRTNRTIVLIPTKIIVSKKNNSL